MAGGGVVAEDGLKVPPLLPSDRLVPDIAYFPRRPEHVRAGFRGHGPGTWKPKRNGTDRHKYDYD